jgi:hypothetical protein
MGLPPPSVLVGVRLSAGIRVVVLSALLFSIGDWWAAPLLLVAAAFTAIFCVLRIVRGLRPPRSGGRPAQPCSRPQEGDADA